jgi:hypothetical protein
MTYTKKRFKSPKKVLPALPIKKKSRSRSRSNSKSKSPKVTEMGNAFNNQNMPPNNPVLSRGTRFTP